MKLTAEDMLSLDLRSPTMAFSYLNGVYPCDNVCHTVCPNSERLP